MSKEDQADKIVISEKKLKAIAEVAHNVNEAYRAAIGETLRGPFKSQTEKFQTGVMLGVVNHLMNPGGVSPEHSHELWMTHKLREGWRYGEVFDEKEKTHPNLLPYSQLPDAQRIKDYLFLAVADSLRDW